MHGSDGERTNTPRSVRYCIPGHALLIFTSSRRQSLRKLSTVTRSLAFDGSTPNCR